MNVETVFTAPDEYRVSITDSDGQHSLLTPTRARDYARLLRADGQHSLRADGWQMLAEDIEDAAAPPDTCVSGDGNYAEWGSYCGPCAQGADDDADQQHQTRRAGA